MQVKDTEHSINNDAILSYKLSYKRSQRDESSRLA